MTLFKCRCSCCRKRDTNFDFELISYMKNSSMKNKKLQEELFKAIEHGDEKHRTWLKKAINKFFSERK